MILKQTAETYSDPRSGVMYEACLLLAKVDYAFARCQFAYL